MIISIFRREDEIEVVKKLVNYKNIEINKEAKEVKIAKDQEIITGSFVKSFAVEKLVDKMKEMGIPRAIINAGGSTLRAVNDDIQSTWGVIVENPNDSENDLFDIEICNETFSTSAQTNTYVEINGKKYGHIISPKTGFPSENKQIGIITFRYENTNTCYNSLHFCKLDGYSVDSLVIIFIQKREY